MEAYLGVMAWDYMGHNPASNRGTGMSKKM